MKDRDAKPKGLYRSGVAAGCISVQIFLEASGKRVLIFLYKYTMGKPVEKQGRKAKGLSLGEHGSRLRD